MTPAAVPPNEAQRLAALRSYRVLDTEFEKEYDDLCRLAATICNTPIALISFIDSDRQWFKAAVGLGVRETARDLAFCAHAIWQDQVFEVSDATQDVRFADNPLVLGDPDIRFYAGQPLINADGLALGTLCTIDKVPRTLTENQRKALDILARQVVTHLELRRAMVDLQRLNEDKNKFFSIIAHDLRSPFSGLLGLIDLMKESGPTLGSKEFLQYIDLIHESLHRVYALMENLLRWAQLEQGQMPFHPQALSVSGLVENVMLSLKETLDRKKLALELVVPPGARLTGDPHMLESAFRNLVSNAAKFTPPGGRLTLKAEASPQHWRLSVTDSGVGMSTEQLQQLQSGLMARSRPGTEGETGTGLGLTLVRQFAARHGGSLEVASTLGSGTTATLVLPR